MHRDEVAYSEARGETVADLTLEASADGQFLTSTCLRCSAVARIELMRFPKHGFGIGRDTETPSDMPTVEYFTCQCGRPHAGRSDEAMYKGCGLSWVAIMSSDATKNG